MISALLSIVLAVALTACPQNPPADTPSENPDGEATPPPLHTVPGLHLIYTVNDPRSATLGADRLAHVLIAEPDGSRRQILFSFPGFIFHTIPSPQGTTIAFVGSVWGESGEDERHLLIYNLESGTYADVSAPGFYSRAVKSAPLFTPDGRWVLFLSRWSVDTGEFNIFKCDVTTGRIGGLVTDPVEDVPLGLMPDGRHCIAVRRNPDHASVFEYLSIDIETGSPEVIHEFRNVTKVGPPHVDDDGTTIYCDVKPFDEEGGMLGGIRSRHALAIDLESHTEHLLLEPDTVTYVYQLFTDAEGTRRLLLRRQEAIEGEDTPMSRIAIANLDGSDYRYLTDTSARSYLLPPPSNIPHVSPDYSLLFFYRQDPVFEHEDIWVMYPDGNDPVNISNTAGYNEGSAGWIVIPPP